MKALVFKVNGLCCAEEVAILKDALGDAAGGEDHLVFDVMNSKLTVVNPPDNLDEQVVITRVNGTGMRALPWREHLAQGDVPQSWWQRHGRNAMCAASGVTLLLATAMNAFANGPLAAIQGHTDFNPAGYAVIALYAMAVLTGAWYVLPKAYFAAKRLRPDMNLLMVVAIAGAIGLGEWFEAATVAFLFALSLVLEAWSVGRARRAISSLLDLSPQLARYRCPTDGCITERPVAEVGEGATVLVKPGERIPLDGVVTSGATTVNEAPITGEARPVDKTEGDGVYAGTLNNDGAFEFRVTHGANDTTLARIIEMIEEAQTRRAPAEQWVERFARYYTPVMMAIALAVAVAPPLLFAAAWTPWFYQGLVVLVIACPCALVISTPVSVVAGLAAAARNGVLIKGGVYLEMPAQIKAIALDKTGTFTLGTPRVHDVIPFNGHTKTELVERAAALESRSEHPVAKAVLAYAHDEGVTYGDVADFQAVQGKGAEGAYSGTAYWVGSHRMLEERGVATADEAQQALAVESSGRSLVAVGTGEHVCGLITVADQLRDGAAGVVRQLHEAGIDYVCMLTGDNEATARDIAEALGVDSYRAGLLPEEKVAAVQALRNEWGALAMVGDGINDAPAMAESSLGIAMGAAGSDTAIETADIALMADDLTRLPWLIRHSRRVRRVIKQNVAFALGLKALFLALAFAGLATLWMAILADMGASLLVITNALRLLRAN